MSLNFGLGSKNLSPTYSFVRIQFEIRMCPSCLKLHTYTRIFRAQTKYDSFTYVSNLFAENGEVIYDTQYSELK